MKEHKVERRIIKVRGNAMKKIEVSWRKGKWKAKIIKKGIAGEKKMIIKKN